MLNHSTGTRRAVVDAKMRRLRSGLDASSTLSSPLYLLPS
jgi:hypothetical protein